jgi:hypothetical protein
MNTTLFTFNNLNLLVAASTPPLKFGLINTFRGIIPIGGPGVIIIPGLGGPPICGCMGGRILIVKPPRPPPLFNGIGW